MHSTEEVLEQLKARAKPDQLAGMARFGLTGQKRLGVAVPEMRKIAKEIGRDQVLSLALWRTGITDAMILASMVGVPSEVSEAQMEDWVVDFHSWDVCDQVCMNLFEKTPFAWNKTVEWSSREEEFVKRAAFALVACLAWHDKGVPDEAFIELLPLIEAAATDSRDMVKKAVSWALRNIGKRNPRLNQVAMQTARTLRASDSRPARWIGSDAIRDLTSEATARRFARMAKKGEP
jgi:3-methyladenine DNA glycosylase AlkD